MVDDPKQDNTRLITQVDAMCETIKDQKRILNEDKLKSREVEKRRRDKNMRKQRGRLERFIKKPWSREKGISERDKGRGQSIQCAFSCYEIKRRKKRDLMNKWKDGEIHRRERKTRINQITFTQDEIIDEIIENDRWFNPNFKRNGIPWPADRGSDHSCDTMKSYKWRGDEVIYMKDDDPMKRKAIRHVLLANVLNEKNYRESSTRVSESSVILKGWIEVAGPSTYRLA